MLFFFSAARLVYGVDDHAYLRRIYMARAAKAEVEDASTATLYESTYFSLQEYQVLIYGHIAMMALAWVFILPAVTMLSLARHRYKFLTQLGFLISNALGLFLGVMYDSRTPDLYPNNVHHKLGWALTWLVAAHFIISQLDRLSQILRWFLDDGGERPGFMPLSSLHDDEQVLDTGLLQEDFELSGDSALGTGPLTGTRASTSRDSTPFLSADRQPEDQVAANQQSSHAWLNSRVATLLHRRSWSAKTRHALSMVLQQTWKTLSFTTNLVDRILLILGFTALCTGIATFGRLFEGDNMLNGIAHWVKGGIFFWFGVLTLGRWSGAFGEIGWSWNVRPKNAKGWRPSSESVESALIFLYGATNIFLEHLSGWGGKWEARDLEHLSITVLFIGGGLCGMLVESSTIRELLDANVSDGAREEGSVIDSTFDEEEGRSSDATSHCRPSLNPMPALVILLLGRMMTSHEQDSVVSTMIHKQWGNLLSGSSFARALTYVLMYLRPPSSIMPTRPPTELLTSFGLMSGGILLMASSTDTVNGISRHELDAMFFFTITMGFVGILMAWILALLALKGWATRRERVFSKEH